ncbi:MAG: outer membrane beta-barrel protein, partial [Deltaproteobacteria bacterium]|nr:outer membrane beta-barrel protein [Deltaproteobacteria bacterium]
MCRTLLALGILLLGTTPAWARGGGFVGFGIGGAATDGAKYVELETFWTSCPRVPGEDFCRDRVHTDGADGAAFHVGFGYNFFGYAALEASVAINGNLDSGGGKPEGAGHVAGLVKLFPAQFVPRADIRARWWDPYVYGGAGYSWMGYHLDMDPRHKARGWSGLSWQTGFGADFYLTKTVAVGADFRFILPRYSVFYEDWGDSDDEPAATPKALVFAPTVTFTFHFADPLPREAVTPIIE